jgi:phosphate starvation-inducible protein PhoH and related proteins
MKRAQKVQTDRVQKEKFQRNQFPVLNPRNDKQKELLEALKYTTIVVAQGSAGVGKTMLACHHAAKKLHFGDIKKVVLIRAYQPLAGRSIGLLPGTAEEKLLPFYQQMIDYFEDFLGKATTEIHLKNKTIEICSLETIRGRSWNDAIILIDESQSLFVPEVQALTTRIGEHSQMIFCGDNTGNQTDVKNGMDGLTYLNRLVNKYSIPDIEFVSFTREHICRSDIVKDFVIAYEEELIADEKGLETIVSKADVDKQFKKGR